MSLPTGKNGADPVTADICGGTLLNEPAPDFLKGETAAFEYIAENPVHVTPREAFKLGKARRAVTQLGV